VISHLFAFLVYHHARPLIISQWNILIDEDNHGVQICDFGLSTLEIPALNQPRPGAGALGSPHFMAPEQFEESGGHLSKQVDIWAFGCVCWTVKKIYSVDRSQQTLKSTYPGLYRTNAV
jgi:serine/threonine protein kinase